MRLEQVLILRVQADITIAGDALAKDGKEVRVVRVDIGKQAERAHHEVVRTPFVGQRQSPVWVIASQVGLRVIGVPWLVALAEERPDTISRAVRSQFCVEGFVPVEVSARADDLLRQSSLDQGEKLRRSDCAGW